MNEEKVRIDRESQEDSSVNNVNMKRGSRFWSIPRKWRGLDMLVQLFLRLIHALIYLQQPVAVTTRNVSAEIKDEPWVIHHFILVTNLTIIGITQ